MKPYAWSMDGEMWPHITPLMVKQGQRVEFELVNQTMMAHPIHLHGHSFQVVAIDGRPFQGAVRDTVLVMPRARVRIAWPTSTCLGRLCRSAWPSRLSNPGSLFRCSLDGSPSDPPTETDDGQKRNLSLV